MKILVRPADLVADRQAIIRTIARDLNPQSDDRRYEWMYLNNPDGPARVWLAEDGSGGDLIGMASAFPRRMEYLGQELLGWVLGDFCIAEQHRTLGPAIQLQRAIVSGVDSGMADLFYDFPSRAMIAVYRRLGIPVSGEIVRFAKPLNCDRFVRERVPFRWLARPLSSFGNILLSLRDHARPKSSSFSIVDVQHKDFEGAFTSLWEEAKSRYGMAVRRSDQYLNWRYTQIPFGQYEMVMAYRQKNILGYAVLTRDATAGSLIDCIEGAEPKVASGLVRFMAERLRKQGAETLSMSVLQGNWWASELEDLGFSPRESSPFVTYLSSRTRERLGYGGAIQSIVMPGDRDC